MEERRRGSRGGASAAFDAEARQAAEVYATYQRVLADANALDFGDLLLQTVELFERFPEVLAHYRRRWQYVLVDEYQDTNRVQYRLVQQLVAEHGNLCVVGDPDQSIYAWRGADIHNILDFERDFPGANVVKLERNYRSTQPILAGASVVVANNVARKGKALFTDREGGEPIRLFEARDERDEAQLVVREIVALVRDEGRAYGDFAIFYRTNAQSRLFEEELLGTTCPTWWWAACASTTAPRSRTRSPTCGCAEPGRRRGAAPDREQARARHRQGDPRARGGARRAARHFAVRGAAPLRRERRGRARGAADPRVPAR